VKRGETPCLGVCAGGPVVWSTPRACGTRRDAGACSSASWSSTSRAAARWRRGVPPPAVAGGGA
jgi:hypothetical protein